MARRIPRYEQIHEFERAEGLPLSEPSAKTLRREKRKQRRGVALAFFVALLVVGGAVFGLYEWWRPGGPPPPPPPLPGHVYPVRHEHGLFVVDKGYAYMKRVVCEFGFGEDEPKVEPVPNSGGKELITCVLYGSEGVESFTYSRSQEYELP